MGGGRILFTMGDPLSINCEAFMRTALLAAPRRAVVIVGSQWQFLYQLKSLGLEPPLVTVVQSIDQIDAPGVYLHDPKPGFAHKPPQEMTPAERGVLMVEALEAVPKSSYFATAVLTAPIDKHAASLAGFSFPGQTEFFESLWSAQAVMLLAGPKLRVALATNHLALSQVSLALNQALIKQKLLILHEGLRIVFGIMAPRIAVCGVNPHCGDSGLFGDEEDRIIVPAVKSACGQINVGSIEGPLPADTVFYRALHGGYDAVLAQYHDQGLGPLKTIHFDDAVNISLGLPYLRVSPDHGPAADLYGSGKASFKSFQAAVNLCERWLDQNKKD